MRLHDLRARWAIGFVVALALALLGAWWWSRESVTATSTADVPLSSVPRDAPSSSSVNVSLGARREAVSSAASNPAASTVTNAPVEAAPVSVDETGDVLVEVVWSDGSPASDIGIKLGNEFALRELHARTDVSGNVFFERVSIGRRSISADRGARASTTITRGLQTVRLTLEDGDDFAVLVEDELGLPIGGVRLSSAAKNPRAKPWDLARTDESGRALLRDLPAGSCVTAHKSGHDASPCIQLDVTTANVERPLVIVLPRGGARLSGTVREATSGAVLANVLVSAQSTSPRAAHGAAPGGVVQLHRPSTPFVARTAADGSYVLDGLPTRVNLDLVVVAEEHAPATWSFGFEGPAESTRDFALTKQARVAGVVVDADARPVHRALVQIGDQRRPSYVFAYTDEAGRFVLRDAPHGSVELDVRAQRGQWARVPLVLPGDHDALRVELCAAASRTGNVRCSDGRPIAGAVVTLSLVEPSPAVTRWGMSSTETDAEGDFWFASDVQRSGWLLAWAKDCLFPLSVAKYDAGTAVELVCADDALGHEVVLVLHTSERVETTELAAVRLVQVATGYSAARPFDGDGRCTFENVAAGRYAVQYVFAVDDVREGPNVDATPTGAAQRVSIALDDVRRTK